MPRTGWQCVFCHKVFDTEDEAVIHENEHVTVQKIDKYEFDTDNKVSRIFCTLSDNTTATFVREGKVFRGFISRDTSNDNLQYNY